jgi:prepilin-type N-terminal cleavage/methylation domain-containing protein
MNVLTVSGRSRSFGFTLIELLVVIAIIVCSLHFVCPQCNEFVRRLRTQQQEAASC